MAKSFGPKIVEELQELNKTTKKMSTVKLPSGNASAKGTVENEVGAIEMTVAAGLGALITGGQKDAKDMATLLGVAKDKTSNIFAVISGDIADMSTNIDNITTTFDNLFSKIQEGKADGLVEVIKKGNAELFKVVESIEGYVNAIQKQNFNSNNKEKSEASVKVVVEGGEGLDKIVDAIKSLKEQITELGTSDSENSLKAIEVRLDTIKQLFEKNIAETAAAIQNNKKNIEIIEEGTKKAQETAVKGSEVDKKKIQDSKDNTAEMIGAIAIAAGMMLLGGLILLKFPGMAEKSLEFAGLLTAFLGATMIPIIMADVIMKKYGDSQANFEQIADLIATAGFVMVIGALFMQIKGLWIHVLEFSGLLGLFLLSTLSAINIAMKIGGIDKEMSKSLDAIGNLIMRAGLIMTVGALFMKLDLWKESLQFGGVLTAFIAMIMIPIVLMTRISGQKEQKSVQGFEKLVVACSLVMIAGALIMMLDNGKFVKNALLFGVVLMAFTVLVTLPLLLFRLLKSELDKSIRAFSAFVVTCTIVMVIGALFVRLGGGQFIRDAFLFAISLSVFIALVVAPFLILNKLLPGATAGLKSILVFIVASSMLMVFGAILVVKEPWIIAGAFGFAAVLDLFIFSILSIVALYGKMADAEMPDLLGIAAFVGVCGAIMMIGAMWIMEDAGAKFIAAMKFAGSLDAFMLAILIPMLVWGKLADAEMPSVKQIAILVGICAAIMMAGALFMKDEPQNPIAALEFTGVLLLFMGGMAGVLFLLSKAPGIKEGSLALLIMSASVAILGATLLLVSKVVNEVGDMNKLWVGIGMIGAIIAGLTAVVVVLGIASAINPISAAAFWAGVGALAALSGVVLVLSTALYLLAKTVKISSDIDPKSISDAGEKIGTFISSIANVAKNSWKEILVATSLTPALMGMGVAIGKIASVIADISLLKVAEEWDPVTGKVTKYRQLKPEDFKNAAENIGLLVTSFANAINNTYTKKKALFEFDDNGNSPIKKVIDSCVGMGDMIASIAAGVSAYANLSVPVAWDKNGKPIKYRQLKKDDFTQAGEYVGLIITTLAGEIKKTYDGNESLFNWKLGGSPISKVIDASLKMGEVLAVLGTSIVNYADLRIPTKWDKEGNPVEWRSMIDTDFTNAQENIKKVLTTSILAVSNVWKDERLKNTNQKEVIKIAEGLTKVNAAIMPIFDDIATIVEKITAEKISTNIDKAGEGIETIISTFSKILSQINSLYDNAESVQKNVDTTVAVFKGILDITNTSVDIKKQLTDFDDVIKHLKGTLDLTNELSQSVNTTTLDNVTSAMQSLSNIVNIIKQTLIPTKSETTIGSFLRDAAGISDSSFDGQEILRQAVFLKDIISALNEAAKIAVNVNSDDFDNLNSSINQLFTTVKDIDKDDISKLKKTERVIDKYVKSVNSIKLSNINAATNLVNSMVKLAEKVGSLDKFIKALNGELTGTLDRLAKEIKTAEATIKSADKIQKERHKLIEKSVSEVKKMMQETLKVEVKSSDSGIDGYEE